MIFFKHIDIRDFEAIQEKTLAYINYTNHHHIGLYRFDWNEYKKVCPEILTCLDDYAVKTKNAGTYITNIQANSKIHLDYVDNRRPNYRLNIPILNCEGSYTEFYTGGIYVSTRQKDDSLYKEITPESEKYCLKRAEVEIIRPTLISVQTPHRVRINARKIPRICLTVYLDRDPWKFIEMN